MKEQAKKKNVRLFLTLGVVGILVCTVVGIAAWTAINNPAFASIIGNAPAPAQEEAHWAHVDILKPLPNPLNAGAFAAVGEHHAS